MTRTRVALEVIARASAGVLLAIGVWVALGRDIGPQLGDVRFGGIDRTQYAELARLPAQTPTGNLPQLEVMRLIQTHTPPDAYFLVMWQSLFSYYTHRRFIRDLDPRMVPFYRARTVQTGFRELEKLGITYVFLPPWRWPTIEHSLIPAIIADPRLATLDFSFAGYRVYRLKTAARVK